MTENKRDRQSSPALQKSEELPRAISLPSPSKDAQQYVAKLLDWTESSFDPDVVIGGPKCSVD